MIGFDGTAGPYLSFALGAAVVALIARKLLAKPTRTSRSGGKRRKESKQTSGKVQHERKRGYTKVAAAPRAADPDAPPRARV